MQTVDKLLADARATIRISNPIGVRAFMMSELTIGGSNQWSSMLRSASQEALNDQKDRITGAMNTLAGKFGKDGIPAFSVKSRDQTLESWSASTKPEFSMEILLLATKKDDNILLAAKKLYSSVYPDAVGAGLTDLFIAPLGYANQQKKTDSGIVISGTFTVAIGPWFQGSKMVMNHVSLTFSKETHSNNTPLYARGNVTFCPAIMPTKSEFLQYFVATAGEDRYVY
jgi:hypothetical protein